MNPLIPLVAHGLAGIYFFVMFIRAVSKEDKLGILVYYPVSLLTATSAASISAFML